MNERTSSSSTALIFASKQGHLDVVNALVAAGDISILLSKVEVFHAAYMLLFNDIYTQDRQW